MSSLTASPAGRPTTIGGLQPRERLSATASFWLVVAFGLSAWWTAVADQRLVAIAALLVALLCGIGLVMQVVEDVMGVLLALLVVRASLDAVLFAGNRTIGVGLSEVAGIVLIAGGIAFLLSEVLWRRLDLSASATGALLFLAASLASIPASLAVGTSIAFASRVAAYVLFFVVLETWVHRRQAAWTVIGALLLSVAVPLTVGSWQLVTGQGLLDRGGFPSVVGTFGHPNTYGRYLGLILVVAVAVYPVASRAWRLAIVTLSPLLLLHLVQTYARSAWIATAIGIVVVVGLRRRQILPAALLAGLLAVGAFSVPSVSERFSDLTTSAAADAQTSNSLEWRLLQWQRVAPLSTRNPVTGIGAGTSDDVNQGGKAPHNDYLRAIVEMGWIGGLTYLAFLVLLVRRARSALREAGDERQRAIAGAFTGVLATVLVVSVTENLMYQVAFMTYFLALAAATARPPRRAG